MITQTILLSLIDEPVAAVRNNIDPDSILELAEDIRHVGLIQPITVKPVLDRYEVVAGHRRFLAMQLLGYTSTVAIVSDGEVFNSDLIKLHENYNREEVSPLDEALFFSQLLTSNNYSPDQLALKIGRSKSYVISRLSLLSLPDIIGHALAEGSINQSAALALSRCPNSDYLQYYLSQAIDSGANVRTIQSWLLSCPAQSTHSDGTPPPPADGLGVVSQSPQPLWACYLCGESKGADQFLMKPVCMACNTAVVGGQRPA